MTRARRENEPTEDEFRHEVEKLGRQLGYHVIGPPPATKDRHGRWSTRAANGMLDNLFIRPPRVLFVEFKGVGTPVRPSQVVTMAHLRECPGVECYLWRVGVDTYQAIADVLALRHPPRVEAP